MTLESPPPGLPPLCRKIIISYDMITYIVKCTLTNKFVTCNILFKVKAYSNLQENKNI